MTDWKLWSEQPPTRADADERGLVECYGKDTGGRWFADLEPLLAVGDWVYWRTPNASLQMSIQNPMLLDKFEEGQKFYVDFTPA
jgi:hypothetical protein